MDREFYISSKLTDIEILAQRAKVMIEDLSEDYFSNRPQADVWKAIGYYYDKASTKVDIANVMIFELMKGLSTLRSVLEIEEDDVEREIKIYDFMDKHNCDRDVAELLFQDQEEK
ncbi:hypothetical protein [Lacrimispora brassicae]